MNKTKAKKNIFAHMRSALGMACCLVGLSGVGCAQFRQTLADMSDPYDAIMYKGIEFGKVIILSSGCATKNIYGGSVLHAAASKVTTPEDAEFFLNLGLDINQKNDNGSTPVFYASPLMLEELIRRGADIHLKNKDGQTPLSCRLTSAGRIYQETSDYAVLEEISILIRNGADVNELFDGKTILDLVMEEQSPTSSTMKCANEPWVPEECRYIHIDITNKIISLLVENGAKHAKDL